MKENLNKILNKYTILTVLIFSASFFYAIYDINNNNEIVEFIKNIKIVNYSVFITAYLVILSIIILGLFKMKKIATVFTIVKSDKDKIFKTLKLFLLGYFLGNFIGLNDIFIKLIN